MSSPTPDQKPLRLFYAYAHKDERLRDKLETALAPLRRQGLIHEWHDRKIGAGQEWRGEIDQQLEAADIILLLISPDFIASDYCYSTEMKHALARHQEGKAQVVPIIVRTVNWQSTELGRLQALPKDGKSVDRWTAKDAAWANVEEGIRSIIQRFRQRQQLALDGTSKQTFALQKMIKKHLASIAGFAGVPKASRSSICRVRMARL